MSKKEQVTATVMEQLSMGNKIFADTRIMMDAYLNLLIRTMIEKDLAAGSIGMKINVEIKKQVTEDGEIVYMPEFEPKINIKVGAGVSDKSHVKKGLVMKRNQDGTNYVCENQISMEEMIKEQKGA